MSYKYDSEDLCDQLLAIMTSSGNGLNEQIAAVEAEKIAQGKGVTPTLAQINASAYFYQTWTAKILNKTPAIFYGIEDVSSIENAGAVAKTYKCFVEIVYCDSGQTNDVQRRISRYARALEELFSRNFDAAIGGGLVKIESVRPISFKLELDSDEEIKVGGISLTVTLV